MYRDGGAGGGALARLFARTTFRFQNFLGKDSPRPPTNSRPGRKPSHPPPPQLKIRSAVPDVYGHPAHVKIKTAPSLPSSFSFVVSGVCFLLRLFFAGKMCKWNNRYGTLFGLVAQRASSPTNGCFNQNHIPFHSCSQSQSSSYNSEPFAPKQFAQSQLAFYRLLVTNENRVS